MSVLRAKGMLCFGGIVSTFWQGITVKIVPHSGSRVLNFRMNLLSLVFLSAVIGMLAFSIYYLAVGSHEQEYVLDERTRELESAQASLDIVLNELSELAGRSSALQASMGATMEELIGLNGSSSGLQQSSGLVELIGANSAGNSSIPEIEELKRLSAVLAGAVEPLERIDGVLSSHADILTNIPNGWPLIGGRGRVTFEFGPHVHPFTGQWYLHQGFDIADTPGVPLVASANGRVINAAYDQYNHGWNVIIQHNYGFRTRYSHMRRLNVSEGDLVEQGQQIGSLGSSGLSTGPHLHFEVHLGENVIDPAPFLKMSNEFVRRTSRSRIPGPGGT
ncbi:MAG: M23 family metallopeptidase [Spirochaeta sp.]|nr:M23 family metallopeptidase [Spirochaeta sp.]